MKKLPDSLEIKLHEKLEDTMSDLCTDVAAIKSNYAKKSDLHEEIGKQTKWLAAAIIATAAISLVAARFIL
ncbi:hypothetical protein [Pectobacterium colocasium]|uniref:hypothetical protein n=1 Tax=Pectobacterium colocasium TaxID=2878098 RepID=UPI003B2842C5